VIGGRQHAHIHRNRLPAAKPLEGFFLKHAQQFDLCAERHIADFIQKNGAVISLLEASDALRRRAGERAAFMAEQLAFQQSFGNGGAIDGDERRVGPVAVLVKGAGDPFLAGAGFTADEHVDRLGGDAADFLVDFLHRVAFADQRIPGAGGNAERHWFGHKPVAGIAEILSQGDEARRWRRRSILMRATHWNSWLATRSPRRRR